MPAKPSKPRRPTSVLGPASTDLPARYRARPCSYHHDRRPQTSVHISPRNAKGPSASSAPEVMSATKSCATDMLNVSPLKTRLACRCTDSRQLQSQVSTAMLLHVETTARHALLFLTISLALKPCSKLWRDDVVSIGAVVQLSGGVLVILLGGIFFQVNLAKMHIRKPSDYIS